MLVDFIINIKINASKQAPVGELFWARPVLTPNCCDFRIHIDVLSAKQTDAASLKRLGALVIKLLHLHRGFLMHISFQYRRQDRPTPSPARSTQALCDEAKKDARVVISMKNDWKRIFAFEKLSSEFGRFAL